MSKILDDAASPQTPLPQILCEDGPLLAVNKPAGLLTQGVPEGLPTLEGWVRDYLKAAYQKPGKVYLGIPHRLDRPVSGVIVFARNSKAAARLAEQFRERTVRKWYLAMVEGVPSPSTDRLSDWLLKDAEAAHVYVVPPHVSHAKLAELSYEVLSSHDGRSLVRIELHTGRMHQIRVQLAALGCPIVGDWQYGALTPFPGVEPTDARTEVIALHAEHLELKHPIRYDLIRLSAPLPANWQAFGSDG
ncbi:MAG: RluA family pseudouridine synthase [Planctomycetaceae bacterium]|nr:RluA family pseudouridine synthase [Planctomycetaceae bacterium]